MAPLASDVAVNRPLEGDVAMNRPIADRAMAYDRDAIATITILISIIWTKIAAIASNQALFDA